MLQPVGCLRQNRVYPFSEPFWAWGDGVRLNPRRRQTFSLHFRVRQGKEASSLHSFYSQDVRRTAGNNPALAREEQNVFTSSFKVCASCWALGGRRGARGEGRAPWGRGPRALSSLCKSRPGPLA